MSDAPTTTPEAIKVCEVNDLAEGSVAEVRVGSVPAAAARVGNKVWIVSGRCPHRAGPLTHGRIVEPVKSNCPGEIEVDRGRPAIACPWHGWEFFLDSGEAVSGAGEQVKIYDTEVVDGEVIVYRQVPG